MLDAIQAPILLQLSEVRYAIKIKVTILKN